MKSIWAFQLQFIIYPSKRKREKGWSVQGSVSHTKKEHLHTTHRLSKMVLFSWFKIQNNDMQMKYTSIILHSISLKKNSCCATEYNARQTDQPWHWGPCGRIKDMDSSYIHIQVGSTEEKYIIENYDTLQVVANEYLRISKPSRQKGEEKKKKEFFSILICGSVHPVPACFFELPTVFGFFSWNLNISYASIKTFFLLCQWYILKII